jgi:DNA-binding XRE family transcriptional regulator
MQAIQARLLSPRNADCLWLGDYSAHLLLPPRWEDPGRFDQRCSATDRSIWQLLHVPPKGDIKPSRMQLGSAIRAIRKEKGLSRKQMAERAELHVSYISGVENGGRNPTWTVLGQIKKALGIELVELVKRAEEA